MPDIAAMVQAGAANPWLYLPFAVLLGALHALEPGHSKSMMAAFVVATRGTPAQAALLGGSAAVGHTIIVWALTALGLWLGDKLIYDKAEPWLVLVSGLLIMALAARILWLFRAESGRRHDHHDHHDYHDHHAHAAHGALSHEEAHAREVMQAFSGRKVTNFDIAWFGLSGGLMPCPSAVAVLLVCLQIKAFTLGLVMVAGFSVGLAITLVSVGVAAAWGASRARAGWAGFSVWAERIPYISAGVVALIGALVTTKGLSLLGLF
jgi:nickel/cobalt exporter